MKILLCGFMGAGKSTLLERLKNDPETPIIDDLDELIAQQFAAQDESLNDYIARVGWQVFRQNEGQALAQWLAAKFSLGVLSLGGGTLEHHRSLVLDPERSDLLLVWLDTPFETCLQRIRLEGDRPLAKLSDVQLKELFLKREADYQLAHRRLDPAQADAIFTVHQLHNAWKK